MRIPFITEILKRIVPQINATLLVEPEYGFVGQIRFKNGKKTYYNNTSFNINTLGSVGIVKDKGYTTFFLNKMGYKTPIGKTFFSDKLNENISNARTIDDGFEYAKQINFPVILKPNSSSQGAFVTKINNRTEYYRIAKKILKRSSVMLVEKFYGGLADYRIVVLDDEIISVYQRIPLSITGDGKTSIKKILEKKQEDFINSGRDTIIDFEDYRIMMNLKRLKFSYDTILPLNQNLAILDNANLSTGGMAIDLTKDIDKKFKSLALAVTKDMELRLCGVDILAEDITKYSENYVILELNGAPGLDNYASIGDEQQKKVDELYLKILKQLERA